jgi:hypothetical protein
LGLRAGKSWRRRRLFSSFRLQAATNPELLRVYVAQRPIASGRVGFRFSAPLDDLARVKACQKTAATSGVLAADLALSASLAQAARCGGCP